MQSENISKILYPNDEDIKGKELRLEQQYFFVSASLQNSGAIHLRHGRPLEKFHEKWAIQMNDTHPSISVAELMRLLVDEHGMAWEAGLGNYPQSLATRITRCFRKPWRNGPSRYSRGCCPGISRLFTRSTAAFLDEVRAKFPGDKDRLRRFSLIDESGRTYIRMANLATVGSHAVNGVAKLHTRVA